MTAQDSEVFSRATLALERRLRRVGIREWRAVRPDDFTDARNWLTRELDALHGEQYFAGIFAHMQKSPVLKEKGRGRSDVLRLLDHWFNG